MYWISKLLFSMPIEWVLPLEWYHHCIEKLNIWSNIAISCLILKILWQLEMLFHLEIFQRDMDDCYLNIFQILALKMKNLMLPMACDCYKSFIIRAYWNFIEYLLIFIILSCLCNILLIRIKIVQNMLVKL